MKYTVNDIYNFIDSIAPFDTQCEWDNSGLLNGVSYSEVSKIGFALDADIDTIAEALKEGCNLLVTHHPVIFKPISSIVPDSPLELLVRARLPIICAHTNFDKSDFGVNAVLAEKIGLTETQRFATDSEASMCVKGVIEKTDSDSFARLLSEKLNAKVSYSSRVHEISSVAVCGGAGGDFIPELSKSTADAFVTGEIKYHDFLYACEHNFSVFACGHFETEMPAMDRLREMTEKETGISCVTLNQPNPVKYIGE